jgi:HYDIN/CFA65/VesB family protein
MVKLPAPSKLLGLVVAAVAFLGLPAVASAAPVEGPGSPLTTSPSPIVAPKTTVGNNGAALQVEITNPGEEAFVDKVSLEGEEAGEFFVNGSDCSTLGEGQKCSFWLGLKPGSVGLKQATMVVTFQGGRPPEAFPVSGESVAPQLSFAPDSHDFGIQRVNRDSTSTVFELTNTGEAPVSPNSVGIQGDTEAFGTGNSDCWGMSSVWLEPGQSCSVEVHFYPREQRDYTAQLVAWANGSSFSAGLSGRGGRAVIEAPENPVAFGSATVGSEGAVKTIALTNSGELPTGFFIGVIAGGDSGSFRLLDENCTFKELMPGGTCVAHVRFTPQDAGQKAARLAFFGDGDEPAMVVLTGAGVAPAATLLPSGFDFGSLAAGTRSVPHAFAVRNDGAAPLLLARVAVVGPDLDQFELAGEECTGTSLDPGEECLAWVRFAPDRAGVKRATLRVAGSGTVLTAGLAGLADPVRKHRGKRPRFVRNKTIHGGVQKLGRAAELRAAAARR